MKRTGVQLRGIEPLDSWPVLKEEKKKKRTQSPNTDTDPRCGLGSWPQWLPWSLCGLAAVASPQFCTVINLHFSYASGELGFCKKQHKAPFKNEQGAWRKQEYKPDLQSSGVVPLVPGEISCESQYPVQPFIIYAPMTLSISLTLINFIQPTLTTVRLYKWTSTARQEINKH